LRSIGYETDKDILELFGMADEVKADKKTLEKHVGKRLAARVLRTWVEDFVDEDTGEVVSIERNEIILERDTVLDESNIAMILEMEAKSVFIQKEEVSGDYAIIYNTLNKDTSNSELEAFSISTNNCVALMHRMMKPPVVSSTNCSSATSVMTWVKLVVTRSTVASD
jgi:DNA-directed RNA polymerase subunit beta